MHYKNTHNKNFKLKLQQHFCYDDLKILLQNNKTR